MFHKTLFDHFVSFQYSGEILVNQISSFEYIFFMFSCFSTSIMLFLSTSLGRSVILVLYFLNLTPSLEPYLLALDSETVIV